MTNIRIQCGCVDIGGSFIAGCQRPIYFDCCVVPACDQRTRISIVSKSQAAARPTADGTRPFLFIPEDVAAIGQCSYGRLGRGILQHHYIVPAEQVMRCRQTYLKDTADQMMVYGEIPALGA